MQIKVENEYIVDRLKQIRLIPKTCVWECVGVYGRSGSKERMLLSFLPFAPWKQRHKHTYDKAWHYVQP